jgi:hypothetical protein
VSTGVPIFLVSACASPEEFFAAFRRYADRAGLFVPSAQPVPSARRGRFALTLKDGGVMIEGEGEVLQSSHKPQGLHGRAGMTIKFTDLDEPSRTVLGELEKARFAMKPAPPNVAPRPSQAPAEPRPVPPKQGGRIDSTNALAECVVIGDLATLSEMGSAAGGAPKAGQKFVVPSIPSRAKTPSVPPPSDVPTVTGPPPVALEPAPKQEASKQTTLGMAALPKDTIATPAKPEPAPAPPAKAEPTTKATTLGMPALRNATLPFGVPTTGSGSTPVPRRNQKPTTPPLVPRQPTPVAPLPIVRAPGENLSGITKVRVEDHAEKTDLASSPPPPAPEPAPPPRPPAPVIAPEPATPATSRSGGMRASEIMAAIPDGDWTMSPDASAPTVLPKDEEPAPALIVAKKPDQGPPTGDWTMKADPSAQDGWAAPAKVAKPKLPPAPPVQPATGNPIHSIGDTSLDAIAIEDKPTSIGAKIEIDPTLMEPLEPMPASESGAAPKPLAPPPMPPTPPAVPMPPPMPLAAGLPRTPFTPQKARMSTDAGNWFKDSEQVARYSSSQLFALDNATDKTKRKRLWMIATGAALGVFAIVIASVLIFGGGGKSKSAPPPQSVVIETAKPPEAGSGSQQVAVAPSPAGSGSAETPAPPAAKTCSIDINSVPPGADVVDSSNKTLGTTPATIELPCGTEAKLWLKKARYLPMTKTVTPTDEHTAVDAGHLQRAQFSVKVTSTPPGATITVGGRPMGVTPSTIKLPAYEASRVTLTKQGYATDTEALTPKVNNMAHHVTLKRGSSHGH